MYIFLDKSLLDLDLDSPDNLSKIEFLLTGYAEGNYIISASRALLNFFIENKNLSRMARDAAAFAYKNFTMIHGFLEKIPFKIIIKDKKEIVNTENQWILSLQDISYGFCVGGILILGENLNDSKFLNFTAKHYQIKSELLSKFNIINNFHGGGGSTTSNELDNLLNKKLNPIFCFLDSDKVSPHCNDSDTAKRCIKSISKNSWISKFCSTNMYREAENLIPYSLLKNINQFPISNIENIKIIEQKYNLTIYPYIDIKNGLTSKFINRIMQTESPKKLFWDNIINNLKNEKIQMECNKVNGECQIHTQLEKNICQILPVGTHKTLDQTIKLLEEMEIKDSFEIIKDDPTSKEWFEIGEIVFWLSCALPKIRMS